MINSILSNAITISLGDLQATDLSTVGGKGVILGRLSAACFDVPPASGYVVGTEAYVMHMHYLREVIASEFSTVNYDDAVQLRDWVCEAEMPAQVAAGVARAYQEMGESDGKANMPLHKTKIAARRKNFALIDRKSITPSKYLQRRLPGAIDVLAAQGEGVLAAKTASAGKVTGTARVVRELSQIGTVNRDEILIVHATDPGWTPVFMLISGIVLETGGLISQGALLAREYGLPGVQIPGALELIPDGATITLDGDTGIVIIHEENALEPEGEVAVA